jgi:hypothetical protein
MGMSTRAGVLRRTITGVSLAIVIAVVGAACSTPPVPPTTTSTTTVPGQIDPELDSLLNDPDFTAQFGDTDEERARIVEATRSVLAADDQWPISEDERALSEQEKLGADKANADAAAIAAADEQRRADAERARLDEQMAGPSLDELAARQDDGSSSFDYSATTEDWAAKEGAADTEAAVTADALTVGARVDEAWSDLESKGRLDEALATPGFVPDQGKGDAQFEAAWAEEIRDRGPATGACVNRDSSRHAPNPASLRPGTVYTPYQNTFAGTSGTPTYLGQLQTTMIGGVRHMIVEGHLGDLNVAGWLPFLEIPTSVRAWITVHTPGNIATNYNGFGPYMQVIQPGQAAESGKMHILCYDEDLGLATGAPIRRAFFRAYIPMVHNGVPLAEPGFQVKATISNLDNNPAFFFGADMRTVYLGKQPLGYTQTLTNGGVGVSVNSGLIVDSNGIPNDDLESTIRGPVSTSLSNALSGLDGVSDWVLGKKGGNWGWFGFHINNSDPGTPNVDINWDQTSVGSTPDDEYRLKGSVSINNWLLEGYTSVPFALAGLVPCYWRFKVDISASIYASVDVNDTARTVLQPNIEIGPLGLNLHNMFVSPLPLGCNFLYTAKWINRIDDLVNALLPQVNQTLANQLSVQPNLPNIVPATVPIGGGNNMQVLFAGWNDTCAPYACNGHGAGDVGMSWAGLEATGDLRFTDTKPASATRRFPASYVPTTAGTANSRVRQHFGDQNEVTDLGAWVHPAVLNQALRVMAEHGRLDLGSSPQQPTTAKSPPVYLSTPIAADKPLGLFLPHLEIDDQANGNVLAVDAMAAVGVTFDPGTRKLVPNAVSPNDPSFALTAWTLKCSSNAWLACYGVPGLVSSLANFVANTVMDPLLQQSIGQVTIPSTGGLPMTSVAVRNEDGHLGVRTSIGAAQFWAWGSMDASTYSFDTFWEGLPGTGPVTYTWSIVDNVSGAVIYTNAGTTQHQLSGLPTSALTPFDVPLNSLDIRSATATVTATRGGVTKTASYTNTALTP